MRTTAIAVEFLRSDMRNFVTGHFSDQILIVWQQQDLIQPYDLAPRIAPAERCAHPLAELEANIQYPMCLPQLRPGAQSLANTRELLFAAY